MALSDFLELGYLFFTNAVSCRVIGVNENDGARLRGEGGYDGVKIDFVAPPVNILAGVGDGFDHFKFGKVFKKRVAGYGYEYFIARVAEEFKQKGIRFACACREDDIFG